MSFEVQVVSGKPEIRKAPAGLVRGQVEEQKVEDRQVSLAELVHSIIEPLRSGLETESEVEISITGAVSVETMSLRSLVGSPLFIADCARTSDSVARPIVCGLL